MNDRATPAAPTPAADTDTAWKALERRLDARLATVEQQIRHYPRPRPACDAQFNHLLEQRAAIPREIARLRAAAGAHPAGTGTADRALEEFVRSCPHLEPNPDA